MEIGDLVKRKKPFPEEKDQIWLITNIKDSPFQFKVIYIMNTYNNYTSKFISHIFCESFEKVEE